MARQLFIDIDQARFVGGLENNQGSGLENLFQHDVAEYELYFVRQNFNAPTIFEPQDFSGRSVKLHIGPAAPSTATAYVAQAAWSNVSSTVTASVSRTITGGTAANEQQLLSFSPEAYGGTFSITIPSRTISLTSVTAGLFTTSGSHGLALFESFTVTGSGTPTGGLVDGSTYYVAQLISRTQFRANATVTTTTITGYAATTAGSVLTYDATTQLIRPSDTAERVSAVVAALSSVGNGNVEVTAVPRKSMRFTFIGAKGQVTLPLMTVAAALTPAYHKKATLNFGTTELLNAISASASLSAVIEVETTEGGVIETLAQTPVTITNDIITNASTTPVVTPYSANLLRVEPTITALTGGAASALDSLATSNGSYPVGICVFFVRSGAPEIWQLTSGTTAENAANGIVRPDDYQASTNEKVWLQRM